MVSTHFQLSSVQMDAAWLTGGWYVGLEEEEPFPFDCLKSMAL
jgi:hypothetical protein